MIKITVNTFKTCSTIQYSIFMQNRINDKESYRTKPVITKKV